MMFWYDHDVSGWGWFMMSVGMILFWIVIIGAGIMIYRALSSPGGGTGRHETSQRAPEQLLAERFARGKIDENEYRKRLAALHESSSSTPTKRA
jgi:putative membrane protein